MEIGLRTLERRKIDPNIAKIWLIWLHVKCLLVKYPRALKKESLTEEVVRNVKIDLLWKLCNTLDLMSIQLSKLSQLKAF